MSDAPHFHVYRVYQVRSLVDTFTTHAAALDHAQERVADDFTTYEIVDARLHPERVKTDGGK